jgi:hypothetical protein
MRCMKSAFVLSILLALALPLSIAAQTPASQTDRNDSEVSRSITAARCQYTPEEQACDATRNRDRADSEAAMSQFSRRAGPAIRTRRPGPYPRGYPPAWGHPTRRRLVIGAIIGFGLGAAVGAKASAHQSSGTQVKTSLGFGAFGGLIGAAIGATAP